MHHHHLHKKENNNQRTRWINKMKNSLASHQRSLTHFSGDSTAKSQRTKNGTFYFQWNYMNASLATLRSAVSVLYFCRNEHIYQICCSQTSFYKIFFVKDSLKMWLVIHWQNTVWVGVLVMG